jgi:hypothetical protein
VEFVKKEPLRAFSAYLMKLGTVSYVRPTGTPCSDAFIRNIRGYKTAHSVELYSNDDSRQVKLACQPPEHFKSRAWFSLSNYVFLCGLNAAVLRGLDFFIYLEDDSRVLGDNWDEKVFDEHFSFDGALFSGTPVAWNAHGNGNESLSATIRYAHEYLEYSGIPMGIFMMGQPHERRGVTLYPNGSGAVYHTQTLVELFPGYQNAAKLCFEIGAWDMEIGRRLWNKFGMDVFKKVRGLKCGYSACTEAFTTEQQRIDMLISGRVVMSHQHKGSWSPN